MVDLTLHWLTDSKLHAAQRTVSCKAVHRRSHAGIHEDDAAEKRSQAVDAYNALASPGRNQAIATDMYDAEYIPILIVHDGRAVLHAGSIALRSPRQIYRSRSHSKPSLVIINQQAIEAD